MRVPAHGIVSATRLHLPASVTEIPEVTKQHLRAYAINAQRLGVVAAIAVNSHEEAVKSLAEAAAPSLELHVLPVPCWGAFVPALNALLDFAQGKGMTHILYQSLEMQCTPVILQKFLDHFNSNVLVVGPVLPGHTFASGQQTLNGRTTPWNTLALWSVRKLALTGFLRIADGMARSSQHEQVSPNSKRRKSLDIGQAPEPPGSREWWSNDNPEEGDFDVPAGVEEVTAIALLQHLLGRHRAIAILLQLPEHLARELSWKTDWGQDERRQQWHEYKMKSKVTRPNAQLQQLFSSKASSRSGRGLKRTRDSNAEGGATPEDAVDDLNFGTVMHFSSTISPSLQVQLTCLLAVGIFYFNSTSVLASAFQCINSSTTSDHTFDSMAYISFIIGGVYILMPVSLQLTRMVTRRFDHAGGLLFFGAVLLFSHLCIIVSQLAGGTIVQRAVLLAARFVQGLGSGVPFQSRFVLASLSTGDLHTNLQACTFMAGDLGLGLGVLLPAVTSAIAGSRELHQDTPELWPSIVQAVICSAFLVWVLVSFPRHLHFLPHQVRFVSSPGSASAISMKLGNHSRPEVSKGTGKAQVLLISGTTRVLVQSAIMPAVALLMHDAQWTGQFRQSIAVATLYLLQLPFEALASRMCCMCSMRTPTRDGISFNRFLLISSVAALLIIAAGSLVSQGDEKLQMLWWRLFQLAGLVVTLALATPINASNLYQLQDAERTIVVLEWMKAYIGRILGPFAAVMIYTHLGYSTLLSLLCVATLTVLVTA